MFKVKGYHDGDTRTIYDVKEENGELKFLYFDKEIKIWKWCYASYFEPVE